MSHGSETGYVIRQGWLKSAALLLAVLALSAGVQCDKITTDPNTRSAPAAPSAQADARLAQKVTCEIGYARLSDVAESLKKTSGVSIYAGQNTKDWRVRDIPMVVCVKDIPLGKLLRLIAGTAHVSLTAERVKGDSRQDATYRFYRKPPDQAAIKKSLDAVADANRKLARWAWDTLVAYAGMPETNVPAIPATNGTGTIGSPTIRAASELLRSFGTVTRDKVFSGTPAYISYDENPRPMDALFEIAYAELQKTVRSQGEQWDVVWTDRPEDKRSSTVRVRREESPAPDAGLGISLQGAWIKCDDSYMSMPWAAEPVRMAKAVAATKELKLAPPPDVESVLNPSDPFPEPGFVQIDPEHDARTPPLDRKVTLKPDPACPYPTLAQRLVMLAKASGLNIVAEDFSSHRRPGQSTAKREASAERTVAAILAEINPVRGHRPKWFVDSNDGVIVRWSDEWRKRHHNLVSRSLLDGITAKREADGAELDDVAPLLGLSCGQFLEWVEGTREYPALETCESQGNPVWKLYSALTAEDRAAAKTEKGLPLDRFDTQWLSEFLLSELKESRQTLIDPYWRAMYAPSIDCLSDPEVLKSCVLQIRQVQEKEWSLYYVDPDGSLKYKAYSWTPGGIDKHIYEIILKGHVNGGEKVVKDTLSEIRFPLLTIDKELDLMKKAEQKAKDEAK